MTRATRTTRQADGAAVRLAGVAMRFREAGRERTVLDGIDLALLPSERAALIGRSGAGKSTVLNLIAGLDLPSAGTVEVMGRDLGMLSEAERTVVRRRHVGFVFQAFNLLPTLSVEENVLLPLDLLGRRARSDRARALSRLETLGLGDRRASFPDVLSGGEQQRVAIARALAHDPELLLADEPTGNLDDRSADRVLELLAEAVDATGVTLVLATHSRRVAALADRVVRLEGGRLIAAP